MTQRYPHFQVLILTLSLLCGAFHASIQASTRHGISHPGVTYRIGFHMWKPGEIYNEAIAGIRDGLDLAGITYEIVTMHADHSKAKAIENLRNMDEMGLDLIYSLSSAGTKIAYEVGMQTPIIATVVHHPTSLGLKTDNPAASKIRLTGTSYYIDTQAQLQLYRTLFPQADKVGMLYDQHNPAGYLAEEPFMRAACQAHNLAFLSIGIETKEQLPAATRQLLEQHVDIIVIPTNHLIYDNLIAVLDVTRTHHIPVVAMNKQGVENGALAALFGDTYKLGRYTAPMAQQILFNKTDPLAIPFQFTSEPDLILNLRAAQQLRYAFPVNVLGSAAIILQ